MEIGLEQLNHPIHKCSAIFSESEEKLIKEDF